MVEQQVIGKHTAALTDNDTEKLYKISVIEKDERTPFPVLSAEQKLLLKGAVIENHTNISNRSHELPPHTLVLNKIITGDKENNFSPNNAQFQEIEKNITAINNVLGTNLEHNPKNDLHLSGVVAEDKTQKIVFSMSNGDAPELYSFGIPMITYSEDSRNAGITQKSHKNLSIGKPLGKIREQAINEASSIGLGIKT